MTAACPVCAEPLSGRPGRCFRCETPLDGWWRFDEAIEGLAGPAGGPGERPHRPAGLLAAGAIGGGLLAAVVLLTFARDAQAPGAPADRGRAEATPPPAVAAPASPRAEDRRTPRPPAEVRPTSGSPAVLRYRVQRGDSPWRIAAAFTGDGRRWRELFPRQPRLVAGQWIEVPAPDRR